MTSTGLSNEVKNNSWTIFTTFGLIKKKKYFSAALRNLYKIKIVFIIHYNFISQICFNFTESNL